MDYQTPAIAMQPKTQPDDADIVTAVTREPTELAEAPKAPEAVAIPIQLDFAYIPSVNPHWKVSHFGKTMIPSPIPVYPKPLALSYRNFYEYYDKYEFRKQEQLVATYPRVIVGSTLISSLLRHYFPAKDYGVKESFPGTSAGAEFTPQSVLDRIPIEGTRHWIVQSKTKSAAVLLVTIITDTMFSKFPGRTQPTQHSIATNFLDSHHRLAVNGDRMARGVVVLLAGVGTPMKPTFEFYGFDYGHQQKGVMMPLALPTQNGHLPATNSLSLSLENAEQVNHMFNIIVHASCGKGAWPDVLSTPSATLPTSTPVTPASVQPLKRKSDQSSTLKSAQKTKRAKKTKFQGSMPPSPTPITVTNLSSTPAPTAPNSPTITPGTLGPADQSARHQIDVRNDKTRKMEHHEISENYVRTVKQNKAGNLIEGNGKMIPNGKSKAIRIVAEMMDHTFRPPNHSRSVAKVV